MAAIPPSPPPPPSYTTFPFIAIGNDIIGQYSRNWPLGRPGAQVKMFPFFLFTFYLTRWRQPFLLHPVPSPGKKCEGISFRRWRFIGILNEMHSLLNSFILTNENHSPKFVFTYQISSILCMQFPWTGNFIDIFIVYQNLIGFCFRQQQGRNRNHNDQTLDRELIETGAVWFRGNSTDLLFHTSSDGTSHRKRSVRMHLIFSESNIWLQRSTSVDDDFNEITTQQNVLAPYP